MKQKVWILLAVLVLLVALTFVRERFEATPTIKAPPYDEAEESRIRNMLSKADSDVIDADTRKNMSGRSSEEFIENYIPHVPGEIVGIFFREVYSPAVKPITEADIDKFLAEPGPIADAGASFRAAVKRLLTSYFMGKAMARSVAIPMGQNSGAPPPLSMNAVPRREVEMDMNAVPGGGMGTTTGSSTGGSSTSSMGPTSGNSGARAKQVFGPVFTARGTSSSGGAAGDSTQTNTYPELMGGRSTGVSTNVEGAGIVAPSKNWLLTTDGSLPSWDSLGSADLSKYFPTSRTPGDMDLIPDPYRLSRNFSTSSYSSKTEPAPFLTDFSAFLK